MKVQISMEGLRLRLGREEFDALLAGGTLRLHAPLPGGWALSLRADTEAGIDGEAGRIDVIVPRVEVDALAHRLPGRDGLAWTLRTGSGHAVIRLEVDLHDGRRRRTVVQGAPPR